MKIRKVVIPVAGLGTRFLPVTKAQPKEMLPIVDKPIIQYIVEEAVRAGITDVILVTGSGKQAIENHFDRNESLENFCLQTGKKQSCKLIREVAELATFIYIRQKGPYGNGTPVLNAKEVIGDEPFAVVWGDDIWLAKKPHIKQLVEVYEKYGDPVITAQLTDDEGTKKYGIIEGTEIEPGIYQVKSIIEKPGPKKTKSRIATFGGYIFTPDIFKMLEKTPKGKDDELWLVDAIAKLMKKRPVYAKIIDGQLYDPGSKLGWLKANVEFALKDKEVKVEFKKFLKTKIKNPS
ncbi:MAG: UTP--glucose-1-phosphate uridylyltransferase [Candidatus Buchananbacteria bacterium RIFCSPHIGHO2_02_FULL_38_8]|uniref:UTP--glucose-1-phosphate uridylyltransferase n=2 Tax=Candidatus Buchananiibacteriota TaxID=1817903 RepID=A0A1G1XXJ5_9BACT|nr:MAG: UTP--glucose-1-phosphate uridylyltransferase [Candidatus Buchananbacteria bacterium RIFCSPHIGHO2_01_FULL_39_8]OGY47553.1 MAG: UTP--glucose-1-phosphate uridylyltransferase [Candidatus Buchananbacteria bacterium RIFCSPHIGHO2_02_FULL_38_8]